MTAKRYVFAIFVFLFAFPVFVGLVGGPVIDPYNVFHVEGIRDNGIEPNKHYIKMAYLLRHPDKFNTFLFGSSKVEAIHTEKIEGENCYNMTYSVGVPAEHLANLRTFLANGIHPDKIYLGVDSSSYKTDPNQHIKQPLRCPYEYLKDHPIYFYSLYMNPAVILGSLYSMHNEHRDYDYAGTFYQYGAYAPYGKGSAVAPAQAMDYDIDDTLLDKTLEEIHAIVEICRSEDIKIVVFVNPTHHTLYRDALSRGHTNFFRRLADITEFYNFDGLNDIALNNNNFRDLSHYKPEIGDMILEVIFGGMKYEGLYEQGFGWKVTKHNVSEFLRLPAISGK